MKHQPKWTAGPVWAAALAIATLAVASCNERDDYPTTTTKTTTVKDATGREYTFVQREEFRRDLDATLVKLDARVDELRAKAATATADGKAKMEAIANDAEAELAEIRTKLSDLGSATEASWNDFRNDLRNAASDLERRLEDAFD
jgi:hypothetical protein